jgi:hypothetical protein
MSIKNILLVLSLFAIHGLQAQKNIDQVLRKYKNDEGVVNMNFTGDVLKMISQADKSLKSTVENVDILMFKNNQNISKDDLAAIEKVLNRDKYELLVDVKNKTQKVKLMAIDGGEYLNKVYAQVQSPEMNAYFVLTGKIIFEELAKLGMDFQSGGPIKVLKSTERGKR